MTSVDFDAGWYVDASADTPDMLQVALDKPEYRPGDTMTVAVTARSAGHLTVNVIGDKLLASQSTDVKEGVAKVNVQVGRDWGTGAYLVATLRRPLDAPAQLMPGRAIGVQWFPIDRAAKTLDARSARALAVAAELDLATAGQSQRACGGRRGANTSSPRSTSAFSI